MIKTTDDDRRFPPALADVARVEFDYAEGEGGDFEPYRAFESAEETTDWLRHWTGNHELDGGAFRLFGMDGTGGQAAIWYARGAIVKSCGSGGVESGCRVVRQGGQWCSRSGRGGFGVVLGGGVAASRLYAHAARPQFSDDGVPGAAIVSRVGDVADVQHGQARQ